MKTSFVLHHEQYALFSAMSDAQAETPEHYERIMRAVSEELGV